jgi:hypothetical protein
MEFYLSASRRLYGVVFKVRIQQGRSYFLKNVTESEYSEPLGIILLLYDDGIAFTMSYVHRIKGSTDTFR